MHHAWAIHRAHTSDVSPLDAPQRRPTVLPAIPKLRASAMRREGADRLESVHRDAPKVEQLPSVREHAKHSYAGSFAISSWMGNNTAEKMDPNTADPSVQS